jgi:predicted cupin superfamily sugar epimerase
MILTVFSAIHRLPLDETYHFYMGDPVEMLLLYPDGHSERVILGHDVLNGQKVQFTVPRGVWQSSHLLLGGITRWLAQPCLLAMKTPLRRRPTAMR